MLACSPCVRVLITFRVSLRILPHLVCACLATMKRVAALGDMAAVASRPTPAATSSHPLMSRWLLGWVGILPF
jgi:hypothetical protein